jgi:hypothetical protein
MSESAIQRAIRHRLGQLRLPFLRYNVGTFYTAQGSVVHIGEKGVSDLIGITPHVVTQEDVGKTVGIFTALEIKKPKGQTAAHRRESQGNYLRLVNRLGGLGAIVKSPEDAETVVTQKWDAKIVIDYSSKDE